MTEQAPQIDQQKEERLSREVIDHVVKEERELSALARILINAVFMIINTAFSQNMVAKEHRANFLNALENGIKLAFDDMRKREEETPN